LKRTGPTSIVTRKLVDELKRVSSVYGGRAWRRVAEILEERSGRRGVAVNVSKINRYAREGEMVVVPGKVLGAGVLEKKVTVAALSFSEQALVKIRLAGGRAITLRQAVNENPRGKNVRIIV